MSTNNFFICFRYYIPRHINNTFSKDLTFTDGYVCSWHLYYLVTFCVRTCRAVSMHFAPEILVFVLKSVDFYSLIWLYGLGAVSVNKNDIPSMDFYTNEKWFEKQSGLNKFVGGSS